MAEYSTVEVQNYNDSPPTDDGLETSDNAVKWSKHLTKIGNPLKTAIEAIDAALVSRFAQTPRYGITAAETDAGVTPTNYQYRPGETRRYPNGLADALLVAVEATATVERNILLTEDLSIGNGEEIVVPSTGTSIASRGIRVEAAPGVYIAYSGDATAVTIGETSATSRKVYWNVPILRSGQDWDDGTDTTSIGIQLIGVADSEIHVDVEGFNAGLNLYGTTGLGNVHNRIYYYRIYDCRIGILIDRNGASEGWSNSNRIWGGLITYRSGTLSTAVSNTTTIKAIDQADDLDNANEIWGDIEMSPAGALTSDSCAIEFNGEFNFFQGRMECVNDYFTQLIKFAASGNCEENVVRITRASGVKHYIRELTSDLSAFKTNRVYYGDECISWEREHELVIREATTDDTPVTITFEDNPYTMPENSGLIATLDLVVIEDDAGTGIALQRKAYFQRATGNLVIDGQANVWSQSDGFSGTAVFAVSGRDAQLVLTGVAATNYRWSGTLRWQVAATQTIVP